MIANLLPLEATHSSLDLFEKPPLLVTFDSAFEQKIGPSYSPTGPTLEFEVIGDRNNFIDLQKIYLEIKCRIRNTNGTVLAYTAGQDDQSDLPVLVNNSLHSLFSECSVTANGVKVSSANGLYAHKSFIETEFSHGKDAKDTWLKCQGYTYETDPAADPTNARKALFRQSTVQHYFGKLAIDFFSCEKHLISGVALRISFRKSNDDFVVISDGADKHYRVEITEANLYVRKMTVSDEVVTAIERTLLKTPAMYRYNEVISKSFLASTGARSWKHEDIFNKEPIRRMVIALNTNQDFLGSNQSNPFHYRKFDLSQIAVYRNGRAIAGTPITADNDNRLYYNSLTSLAYMESGHGITLSDYPNHYVMVFDLTSTLEASHEFIHPELTSSSITVELQFSNALANNTEILFRGEKSSTIFIDSTRRVSKNIMLTVEENGRSRIVSPSAAM